MTADEILAIVAVLTFLGAVAGFLWKLSASISAQTTILKDLIKKSDAQWKKLDEHSDTLDQYGGRLLVLETVTKLKENYHAS
jgi:hypothetical protein